MKAEHKNFQERWDFIPAYDLLLGRWANRGIALKAVIPAKAGIHFALRLPENGFPLSRE
ncbi:hypothetical protein [Dyella sp.]|uniref:hypothetical protein n=1 Tax=Dyella sp. TaxID=1869338 RepID=UPI002FDAF1B0